jgi:hypothetical protein
MWYISQAVDRLEHDLGDMAAEYIALILASMDWGDSPAIKNAVMETAQRHIERSQRYIRESLVPSLRERVAAEVERARRSEILTPELILAILGVFSGRVGEYAGEAWAAAHDTVKTVGEAMDRERAAMGLKPRRVKWLLDPNAQHCVAREGFYACPDMAGEYESLQLLPCTPGNGTACVTNCRCRLLLQEDDGRWVAAVGG